ncbi:large ribosomal subunit protein bL35m [Stomoxys calcitrans]|uniref:large ribosomal subunit protein bL35m n=1 Tax=Stomoxys calcitrans TaxID=35570 RepID=UPI0027E22041|nr:large ribosomal subunit protein bL35m [Stomoxys calcitrans]
MLRSLIGNAIKGVSYASVLRIPIAAPVQKCSFSMLQVYNGSKCYPQITPIEAKSDLLKQSFDLQTPQSRNVTKFSLNKGKRKSVRAVVKRFRRLDWGAWIRTYTGRQKKLFSKSSNCKRRLRQHVFTNSAQSWLLDSMVTSFWRRPKNWVDDIYAPYHKRDEFFATKSKSFKV